MDSGETQQIIATKKESGIEEGVAAAHASPEIITSDWISPPVLTFQPSFSFGTAFRCVEARLQSAWTRDNSITCKIQRIGNG